jgi:hypothetical protein
MYFWSGKKYVLLVRQKICTSGPAKNMYFWSGKKYVQPAMPATGQLHSALCTLRSALSVIRNAVYIHCALSY